MIAYTAVSCTVKCPDTDALALTLRVVYGKLERVILRA